MAAELHDEARALIARLRTPRVTHHQVSDDWEPYKTVAKTHALDPVRVEAADMIERLLAALGVSGTGHQGSCAQTPIEDTSSGKTVGER